MKTRPILFSAPMVQALLAGTKTQTRRIIKPEPYIDGMGNFCAGGWSYGQEIIGNAPKTAFFAEKKCPYGKLGSLLWVREAWQVWKDFDHLAPRDIPPGADVRYGADGEEWRWDSKRRPSMFIPRWASRLTLEIFDVRAQRLQDISEADADAEGVEQLDGIIDEMQLCVLAKKMDIPPTESRAWFAWLWESINGPGSWDANPWIWCVSFRVHHRNIDQMEPS